MDCHRFRRDHLAYLDDTLPGDDMRRAQLHLLQCAACAAHDALVRRSLMLVRSLPSITPGADFQQRLRVRLAEQVLAQGAMADGTTADGAIRAPWGEVGELWAGVRWGRRAPVAYVAAAVVGVMAGAGVWGWWTRFHATAQLAAVPAPVTASPVSRSRRPMPVAALAPMGVQPAFAVQQAGPGLPEWGALSRGVRLEAVLMDEPQVPMRPAAHLPGDIR